MNCKAIKTSISALGAAALLSGSLAFAQNSCMPASTGSTNAQDKKFLKEASKGGLFEITAANLALKNSRNPDVKAFAQRMITDHSTIDNSLAPFEKSMMVTPATRLTPSDQQELARLRSLHGEKFDIEYIRFMDAAHHHDRGAFRAERDTTANAALKATVATDYDTIKQHTDMADALATKMNLPIPADSAPISSPSM